VLVNTVGDCYNALGVVHGLWHPMPGQFDDYIANPKESGYQSLHTTVLCLGARPLEFQIRTHEMHESAEYGIAAHWQYKEGGRGSKRAQDGVAWMRQMLEWRRENRLLRGVRRVRPPRPLPGPGLCLHPKGDVKDLPAGATPLDFRLPRSHRDGGTLHRREG
jgi:GTP pyrophosphokinase